MSTYAYRQAAGIRQALLDRRELALIDVREEADFATAHPLFAVNLPLSKLELEVRRRIPRFTTPITVYDNGEGLAEIAVERLRTWGYQDVALLAEGLAGWRRSGGELFQDVNSASKAFGELVESVRHTPSLSAREVQALIDSRQEVVIVDARRFDEYQTMSIPGSISVPGGELALRVESLTPSPQTPVIVNCAGRTRSSSGNTIPPPAPLAPGPPRWRISPNGPGWRSSMRRPCNAGCSRSTAPPSCLMCAALRSTRRATILAA